MYGNCTKIKSELLSGELDGVCICTFVSSCLETKANNRLLEGCGLLESRPANWGAFDHDAPHILYYISVCQ